MLCWLLGLGLEQEGSLEADLALVLDGHAEEARKVVELLLHVGVEERVVALAAAPEHKVLAPEAMRDLQCLLCLRGCNGSNLGIGARGGSVHVPGVLEELDGRDCDEEPQKGGGGSQHHGCCHSATVSR